MLESMQHLQLRWLKQQLIENIQRDVNIALVNELAVIFNKLGINTNDVLSTANTSGIF